LSLSASTNSPKAHQSGVFFRPASAGLFLPVIFPTSAEQHG
jgi:hypothetical protein